MSLEALAQSLPAAHQKQLAPDAPKPMRMMAAKAMAPLPPREMVIVLCGLSLLEDDEKVSSTAKETLSTLPDKILGPAIDAELPDAALRIVVRHLEGHEGLLEKLLVNRNTSDEIVALIAPSASEKLAEIIAQNQERCLRSEAIVEALRTNKNLIKSSRDRLFDFLVRAGVIYEGMHEFGDAMARLSPAEMKATAEKIEIPPEVAHLINDHKDSDANAEEIAKAFDEDPDQVARRIPILKLIGDLNVAQRISLALKGNKEARAILIRDSNKVVAGAAIRSPRITQPEIVAAAKSTSTPDDVIRVIARSKEMYRHYGVKLALVNNPKTPLGTAMQFLTLLRAHDLRVIAKSKNVPSGVAKQAKRLVMRKR